MADRPAGTTTALGPNRRVIVVDMDKPLPQQSTGRRWGPITQALLQMRPGESMLLKQDSYNAGGRLQTARRHGLVLRTTAEGERTRVWVVENPLIKGGE